MKHINLRLYGRVQGVGFRWAAQKKAEKLGVCGFVTNCPDGSLYIEAEGSTEHVSAFAAWCGKGPWLARVDRVETEGKAVIGFEVFDIRV